MGLIRGEGKILKRKYMKKYGLSQREAIGMVEKFVDEINMIRDKMKTNKKSEKEIELKLQSRFEEEFQKLCCE